MTKSDALWRRDAKNTHRNEERVSSQIVLSLSFFRQHHLHRSFLRHYDLSIVGFFPSHDQCLVDFFPWLVLSVAVWEEKKWRFSSLPVRWSGLVKTVELVKIILMRRTVSVVRVRKEWMETSVKRIIVLVSWIPVGTAVRLSRDISYLMGIDDLLQECVVERLLACSTAVVKNIGKVGCARRRSTIVTRSPVWTEGFVEPRLVIGCANVLEKIILVGYCELTNQRIVIYRAVARSVAYVAILFISLVAMFVVTMDLLKYCFGVDPVGEERKKKTARDFLQRPVQPRKKMTSRHR